ncbi:Putative glycosyl transferase, family 3, anthranilate phosphoribosyl transferase [Colletotrichum destructivum]|uniref:Glycosyl transferase, family 3, anthranilate phosphoribosyl transferase n=1 Tax=Colletotrichum destructivum TaxID=34406 RepID=A0AAX4I2F0_9PEZI|nr:Putative glycosyl transferase, family 3, anthranilate phosphoribosyl transferase [Colletotrichum destructivum]
MASQPPVAGSDAAALPLIDIKPLLKKLWPVPDAGLNVTPDEIAEAISHFFTHQVSDAQAASLLIALHFTNLDRRADVMARSAHVMRRAAAKVDFDDLARVVDRKALAAGRYGGGLCDIVGTGGDAHNTFNISTTASILASSLLLVAKHGNRASTSKSGSADLVNNMQPRPPILMAVSPATLSRVYSATNYGFLFAPVFHPGMRYVAPIRKELPWRTIFNLLGPLANPVEDILEARVIGVARKELGPVFLEALKIGGSKKAMIICGEEELDEVSCAGPTLVWRLAETAPGGEIVTDHFRVQPSDFGLGTHPLNTVSPGKEPAENAEILRRILEGEMADNDPILEFVLMNTATLFVASGICEEETSNMGPGDDGRVITERGPGGGRWKEGVRRARWAVKSGEAWKQWKAFVDVTNSFDQ